ncbi:hypothetical protein N7490_002474 [Penicillium lividum]|nr:hypothetical protein N7490_002474 [Penicillium lividum]
MEKKKENSHHFEEELLPDYDLVNRIKDILENVCETLSTLSSEPLDNALSNLDNDNKLPSILKLSCYIQYWAIDHTREELNRKAQFENEYMELMRNSKNIKDIILENEIYHRMFRPKADGAILSLSDENSISHKESSEPHQEASDNTASSHSISLNGKEKEVSGSISDKLAQSTPASPASKSLMSSPGRGLHAPAPGIISFECPIQ